VPPSRRFPVAKLPALKLECAAVLRRYLALAALVPVLVGAGCGGGGGDDVSSVSGGDKLSADDQLRVIQDRADIEEFCSYKRSAIDSDLYVRGLSVVIDATTDLVQVAQKSPDKIFVARINKIKKPMRQILADEITHLDTNCSKDGKGLAQKMRRATAGISSGS
jgi:hypothetical protein